MIIFNNFEFFAWWILSFAFVLKTNVCFLSILLQCNLKCITLKVLYFTISLTKVVITWSQLAGMKFCPILPGSHQYYKFFINYILRLYVKIFIPARRDPSFVLTGIPLWRDENFPCNRFSPPKRDEKVN